MSKLCPAESGALACIGCPVSSIESLCGSIGASSTLSYMANLVSNLDQHLKLELFPSSSVDDFTDSDSPYYASCSSCGSYLVQSDLEKFMRFQDIGLETSFKCPNCRNCKSCLKGPGEELLTMKEEFQQQIIEESVTIDESLGQAVAKLAFLSNLDERTYYS